MDGIVFGDSDESLWSDMQDDYWCGTPPVAPDDCWLTANGRVIPYVEMTDDHLRNAIRYFKRRRGEVKFFPKRIAGLYAERSRRRREWWLAPVLYLWRLFHA